MKPHRASAEHPIALEIADGLTTSTAPGGRILASSRSAVILREADSPSVFYFPRENVDPSVLTPTPHRTHCPYKGDAAYDAVLGVPDKAWTYYDPYPAVADVAGHVAFHPDAAEAETASIEAPSPDAASVLQFWFEEVKPRQRFEQDDGVDAAVRRRFGALHERAAAGELDGWAGGPDGALALLILLDQFSRNLLRDDPRAYAQDEAARRIASGMVTRGFDLALEPERRAFAYLPFMHAEDIAEQNHSVRLYTERLPGSDNLRHALRHRTEIHRYGRFRGRDEALKR